MTPGLWVSMPIIRNIVEGTGCNGPEIELICRAGGIGPDLLEEADYKLSLEQNCAIIEAALTISGNKYLGLHTGEKTTAVVLGSAGKRDQRHPGRAVLVLLVKIKDQRTLLDIFAKKGKDGEREGVGEIYKSSY